MNRHSLPLWAPILAGCGCGTPNQRNCDLIRCERQRGHRGLSVVNIRATNATDISAAGAPTDSFRNRIGVDIENRNQPQSQNRIDVAEICRRVSGQRRHQTGGGSWNVMSSAAHPLASKQHHRIAAVRSQRAGSLPEPGICCPFFELNRVESDSRNALGQRQPALPEVRSMVTHSEILEFAQKAQTLALVWVEADPVGLLTRVCDLSNEIPRLRRDEDRAALVLILRRVAAALFQPERPRDWPAHARVRRAHIRDVHVTRAINCIRREFANPALDLRAVAKMCRLSPAYLSDLIASHTHHGFRVHLAAIRILHTAHLLATTPLSMKEVADKSGFRSTSALDHEFKKRIHMTPGEFRRWA